MTKFAESISQCTSAGEIRIKHTQFNKDGGLGLGKGLRLLSRAPNNDAIKRPIVNDFPTGFFGPGTALKSKPQEVMFRETLPLTTLANIIRPTQCQRPAPSICQ